MANVFTAKKKSKSDWQFECHNCKKHGEKTVMTVPWEAILNPTEWDFTCNVCNFRTAYYGKCTTHSRSDGSPMYFWKKYASQECPICDKDKKDVSEKKDVKKNVSEKKDVSERKDVSEKKERKERCWKAPCINCNETYRVPLSYIKNPVEHDFTCTGCHKQAMEWSHCDTHNINYWTNTTTDCPKC